MFRLRLVWQAQHQPSTLALATATALDLDLSPATLSTLARRGSGSSTRSLFGGFVEWDMGTASEDSMAHPIDDADWDIGMVVLAVNTGPKRLLVEREWTTQLPPHHFTQPG